MSGYPQYDDARILNGAVKPEEINVLEKELLEDYYRLAEKKGTPVTVIKDRLEYERLRSSGKLHSGHNLYILEQNGKFDMAVVAFHLLETEKGRFYAKLLTMPPCECPQQPKQH